MTIGPAYGATAAAGAAEPEYIAIKHSVSGDDITLTTSNAHYEWTGVNFQSDAGNFTLSAGDDLLFNIGGKFHIDWTLLFASSGGTTIPFWVTCFLELDEGTIGSWSFVTGSLCGASMSDDPGGGQTKMTVTGSLITSLAAGDSLRLRVRRGTGAATTVKSDGGNGSNWNITKLED